MCYRKNVWVTTKISCSGAIHHRGQHLGQDALPPPGAGCGALWQNGGEAAAGSATAGLAAGLAATTASPTGRAARPAT